MKKSILTILFFVAIGMYSQNIIKTYTFSTPTIKLCEDYPGYCYIDADEGYVMSVLAEPEMPSENVIFYIPEDKDIESLEITKQGKTTFNLSVPLKPGQEPIPTSLDYIPSDFTEPSSEIYESDNIYPSSMAEIVDYGYMFLTNKIVNVRITPYEYYPLSGKLDFFSSVTVEVKLKEKSSVMETAALVNRKIQKKELDILKKYVVNPEDLVTIAENVEVDNLPRILHTYRNTGDCLGFEYVIVTSEALAPAFEALVDWKRRKGLDAGIVTMEYIRENYNGDEISGIYDDAGKLRQFLYESYLRGTVYVLLGGDKDVVPIRYGYDYGDMIPTDLYFADFNGNWNFDDDEIYGETNQDDIDYMQEVYIGRILCSNTHEVKNWVDKAMIYEKNPGLGDFSYLKKSFITEADQMMKHENYEKFVKEHFPMFNDTIFYEVYNGLLDSYSDGLPEFPTGTDVINEFNKNYGLVSFMGHGGPENVAVATYHFNDYYPIVFNDSIYKIKHRIYCYDGYYKKPDYYNSGSLESMSNLNYPNINYSISCSNVDYGVIDNLGKFFTSGYKAGCVAFLGNTNSGYYAVDNSSGSPLLFSKFGDALQNGFVSLGIAEALSKIDFDSEFLKFSHNLIGCPEMNMWIDIPKSIDVDIVRDEITGKLSIQLPSKDYKVCITSMNYKEVPYHVVASDFTDMTFSDLPTDYTVVVTRDGYLPYIFTVRNNVYLQNIKYNNVNRQINGYTVTAGYNVDPNHSEGEVVIKGNSKVTIDAESYTEIRNGFNVEKGSVLIIR